MTNAELIKALRCEYYGDDECDKSDCPIWSELGCRSGISNRAAADTLEAAEKRIAELEKSYSWKAYAALEERIEGYKTRIAELEDDLRNSTISNPERFKIYGYTVKDLILFADMCKRNDVKESDLKQAAWNLELCVRAVQNERMEIVKKLSDEMSNCFSVRFIPNFDKAYEEMWRKEQTDAID